MFHFLRILGQDLGWSRNGSTVEKVSLDADEMVPIERITFYCMALLNVLMLGEVTTAR